MKEAPPTLKINVCDVVEVREGTHPVVRAGHELESPYFQPEFRVAMDKDTKWAPARSRAPSITIDFGIFEDGY